MMRKCSADSILCDLPERKLGAKRNDSDLRMSPYS